MSKTKLTEEQAAAANLASGDQAAAAAKVAEEQAAAAQAAAAAKVAEEQAAAAQAAAAGMVRVMVPRAYRYTRPDYKEVDVQPGLQDMPEEMADNWFSVHNGVVKV